MDSGGFGNLAAGWADKARKAVEQAQATLENVQQGGDLESGGGDGLGAGLASWAKGAADMAKKAQEKAAAAEWGEQAKAWQGDLIHTFGKVSDNATKATSGLTEGASAFAGSAKDRFEKAGSGIAGMGALAMSPTKLLQSGGIFFVGMMLISLSLSFLPLLPIKPQKFALLFALGSLTMLASVAQLKGPQAFAAIAMQRDKLPFSGAYLVGLLGTFWATLIARSYLFTSVFAFLQAVGLVYFMASFIPGGQALLNACGRCCRRAAGKTVSKVVMG